MIMSAGAFPPNLKSSCPQGAWQVAQLLREGNDVEGEREPNNEVGIIESVSEW